MIIVGLSAYYHDSAAAILRSGEIIAAAQEERFSRKKADAGFPSQALAYCLSAAGVRAGEVDHVVFYDKPFLKFERIIETYLAVAPRGFQSFRQAVPLWFREKLFLKKLLIDQLAQFDSKVDWRAKMLFTEHHISHAASAFYPSPFDRAAILTLDGVGEWATTTLGTGEGANIALHKEIRFPHSIGLLYSAFTYHLGFKVNSGEYKVMGLAPYGQPRFLETIFKNVIDVKEDGSFHLNMNYFNYAVGLTMTNERFSDLFGIALRNSGDALKQEHLDLAASIQKATEIIVSKIAVDLAKATQMTNLCMAGGVALNCVANGKLHKERIFKRIWVQPAAGDSGGAVGAALFAHYKLNVRYRVPNPNDSMHRALLGPGFTQDEIEQVLTAQGAQFDVLEEEELLRTSAKLLAEGKAVGWFQDRMEFGPRALGARSILADPRRADMQSTLNLKIKYRESFRPFAPAVLAEKAAEWFEFGEISPYMLFVANVNVSKSLPVSEQDVGRQGLDLRHVPKSIIPSVTHVDGTARLQTVDEAANPMFYRLLKAFDDLTGCPVLVNTSFNVRGEPIVLSPQDAFRCFMGTDIEALVIGRCFLRKERQRDELKISYEDAFEPD